MPFVFVHCQDDRLLIGAARTQLNTANDSGEKNAMLPTQDACIVTMVVSWHKSGLGEQVVRTNIPTQIKSEQARGRQTEVDKEGDERTGEVTNKDGRTTLSRQTRTLANTLPHIRTSGS